MNRITQCMHGRGTVSGVMQHRNASPADIPSRFLAFSGMYRPVVFWNLTDRCNLRCVHCYNRSEPGSSSEGELSTAEALGLIDDLAEMHIPLILLTGGEPLMRTDIWELAQHAKKRGIKMALSTNGTLITTDVARRVRESGIEYAGISLDGAQALTHDRFRNSPGAFNRTMAAFASCREAGLRCGVRVTLTTKNCGELEDIIDLALSLGASRFCLYWLVPTGRGIESYEWLQLGKTEVTAALALLYRKAKETDPSSMEFLTVDAPQDCIHLLASMEQDGSPDIDEARQLLQTLKGGCSAGTRVANIDSLGNVYPCQFARSENFLLGNIRHTPFSRIWGDSTNPVLSQFREKQARFGGRCRDCTYRDLCGGGCRVRAYAVNGDFMAEDPFCFVEQGISHIS
jgi:radical SAM protein with 4Fe4S-binding SPASM domain